MRTILLIPLILVLLTGSQLACADSHAKNKSPWGQSKERLIDYKPQKVVYDVTTDNLKVMSHVLNRTSHLSKITGADPFEQSIVIVLHGAAVKFFAIENYDKYKTMLNRAQSLVDSEAVSIRMCQLSAEGQGYQPEDIHGFVKMVPMGDAEIIRLQYEDGYAYMQ